MPSSNSGRDRLEFGLAHGRQYLALRARADELRQSTNATLGRPTKHVDNMFDANADD